MKTHVWLAALCCILYASSPQAEESHVAASIKPLHSLVANVMGDTGIPTLLVTDNQSPHGFHLKPSQVKSIRQADILFYIDESFETYLGKALDNAPDTLHKVVMADQPGITLLNLRGSGIWQPHAHAFSAHGADHETSPARQDNHIWLDMGNAKTMVKIIAAELGKRYPLHRAQYEANAAAALIRLDALDEELRNQLLPVRGKPFIVFHDAFQYFERNYGLTAAGSITLEPEQAPGVRHISEVREKIRSLGVVCVFSEPQFDSRLLQTVMEGVPARTGILDEHGAGIPAGPELYFTLMRKIAAATTECLAPE
jgi:zinc transport system substrate-binding protein